MIAREPYGCLLTVHGISHYGNGSAPAVALADAARRASEYPRASFPQYPSDANELAIFHHVPAVGTCPEIVTVLQAARPEPGEPLHVWRARECAKHLEGASIQAILDLWTPETESEAIAVQQDGWPAGHGAIA